MHYESDVLKEMGYVAHLEAARIFSHEVKNLNAKILNAGCGTGLAGAELLQLIR